MSTETKPSARELAAKLREATEDAQRSGGYYPWVEISADDALAIASELERLADLEAAAQKYPDAFRFLLNAQASLGELSDGA